MRESKIIIIQELKVLMYIWRKYGPEYAVKILTMNFGFENNIKSIPLYAVFCL